MLLSVNDHDPRPIYEQIVSQLKQMIADGKLRAGEQLPAVRELADSLGINLHTVHKAYQKLHADQVIVLRLGRRARVAERPAEPAPKQEVERRLVGQLDQLITEAFHLRLTPQAFRELVDELLQRRTRAKENES
jgi:tape measure domain-containing protein